MADNDKKRYYWLKLRKDFFQSHKIKVLKALPNGRLYTLIYLELLAESTTHEGTLRFSDMLPYDSVTLAAVIDEDKDNIEKAIEILAQLELIEILCDKTIFMSDIQTMLGSGTGQTIRKNLAKVKNTELLPKSYQKNTLENRDKSIENRDKSIEIRDKNIINNRTQKHQYGTYKNVLLSDEDLQKLKLEFPNDYETRIEIVSEYCASTGKHYKNYLATIRLWAKKETLKKEDKLPTYDASQNREYSEDYINELLALRDKE